MRTFIFALILSLTFEKIAGQTANNVQSDTIWCIQVLSTRNPHLIKPEMVSAFPDTAMVEESAGWYRILFLYNDKEQANLYLHSWQRQHDNAFIMLRSRSDIKKMYPLFSTL
jgi:hypothetical protein